MFEQWGSPALRSQGQADWETAQNYSLEQCMGMKQKYERAAMALPVVAHPAPIVSDKPVSVAPVSGKPCKPVRKAKRKAYKCEGH